MDAGRLDEATRPDGAPYTETVAQQRRLARRIG